MHFYCAAVFIADTGSAVYVWIGSGASSDEKKHAMAYAHVGLICGSCYYGFPLLLFHFQQYLKGTKHPLVPVTCLNEGNKNAAFEAILS